MSQAKELQELKEITERLAEEMKKFKETIRAPLEVPERVIFRTVLNNNQVSIRTSNCGRGWVLTTRGRNPHVPNFRKIVVNRPEFELKQGVVYLLDEEERNIVSEAPPIATVPKVPKPVSPEEISTRAKTEAEEILKSLGF